MILVLVLLAAAVALWPTRRGGGSRSLSMRDRATTEAGGERRAEPRDDLVVEDCADALVLLAVALRAGRGTAEAIEQVMGDLLRDLAGVLQERGLGARALRLTGLRVDGTEQVIAVGTSQPTREVPHLLRLLKLKIERIDPGMGLEQFWLVAPHTEPLDAVDLGAVLAGETLVRDPGRLVDVIAGRIGPRAVFRVAPVESHVPERAVARSDPNETPGPWPQWPRPIRLFVRPEPLARVIALMPDQPPRRFEWRGKTYKIVAGDGPERVHGEWWRRDAEVWAVRDYYRVEDREGRRFWLFRQGLYGETDEPRWFVHGLFA